MMHRRYGNNSVAPTALVPPQIASPPEASRTARLIVPCAQAGIPPVHQIAASMPAGPSECAV
eukprot:182628-Pyramimonas_sp.AAC.1